MTKHTCKHCNRIFEYCRGCLLSPIPHKDAGFCSKECYDASKNPTVEPEVIDDVVVVEELTPVVEEVATVDEEVSVNAEVEIEAVALIEKPVVETVAVVESTPKKETYHAYKKKKHKH